MSLHLQPHPPAIPSSGPTLTPSDASRLIIGSPRVRPSHTRVVPPTRLMVGVELCDAYYAGYLDLVPRLILALQRARSQLTPAQLLDLRLELRGAGLTLPPQFGAGEVGDVIPPEPLHIFIASSFPAVSEEILGILSSEVAAIASDVSAFLASSSALSVAAAAAAASPSTPALAWPAPQGGYAWDCEHGEWARNGVRPSQLHATFSSIGAAEAAATGSEATGDGGAGVGMGDNEADSDYAAFEALLGAAIAGQETDKDAT